MDCCTGIWWLHACTWENSSMPLREKNWLFSIEIPLNFHWFSSFHWNTIDCAFIFLVSSSDQFYAYMYQLNSRLITGHNCTFLHEQTLLYATYITRTFCWKPAHTIIHHGYLSVLNHAFNTLINSYNPHKEPSWQETKKCCMKVSITLLIFEIFGVKNNYFLSFFLNCWNNTTLEYFCFQLSY